MLLFVISNIHKHVIQRLYLRTRPRPLAIQAGGGGREGGREGGGGRMRGLGGRVDVAPELVEDV